MICAGSDQTTQKAGKGSDQCHPQGRVEGPSRPGMALPGTSLSFIADNRRPWMPRGQGARRPFEKGERVRVRRGRGIESKPGAIALGRRCKGARQVRAKSLSACIGVMFSPILLESVQEMARAK